MTNLFGKYTALSLDGKAAPAGVVLEFSAGASNGTVRIHARVANILNGQLKQKDNDTLSGPMISTMMMGSTSQMEMEDALSQGFMDGMSYKIGQDGALTLRSGAHVIKCARA
ncbi:META domain containing protein [Novymonas esmeraldas]|uniref:META domain containing protein n=1 Tax=Novymonas esmeraldas TaxID=1808958 RepID=A0AAW0ET31_9TRYP